MRAGVLRKGGFSGVVTAVLGILLIQVILLAGSYSYKSMITSDPGLFRSLSGLFSFLFCLTTVFGLWTAGLTVLTMDVAGLMDGELINFFGHLGGFIIGVILALMLEKLPERENDAVEDLN
ncbi:MAG: rhomboid family intramembrane serine protease [Paludibacter sp.]|nr:rhomboid family intramembrane serine protease [Paludibacter sp.]MDD4429290.1 rhomboid family intramembrane serine protease [Paludibacter sp.]